MGLICDTTGATLMGDIAGRFDLDLHGILLRNSAIPRLDLALIYAAIGGALLQASANYYTHLYAIAAAGQ
jgi:hypothetical protein